MSESRLAIKKQLAKTHGNGGFFRTSLNFENLERNTSIESKTSL